MSPHRNLKKIPLELRRKLFLALSDKVGKQLDAQGVTDEMIERDFEEFKKGRRRE